MKWKIVTDSSSDLQSKELQSKDTGFAVVPLTIRVGEHEYVDDTVLDLNDMLSAMDANKSKTSTACPSPEDWALTFRDADQILVLTITGGLSGSYNSAEIARSMVMEESPEKKIYILDSRSTGPELVLLVEKADELIASGKEFDEICTLLKEYADSSRLLFKLEDLSNLVKNGRMSRLTGTVADVLNIHIVGTASVEGTLDVLHKCRGAAKAHASMIRDMLDCGYEGGKVLISHCSNEKGALLLKEKLLAKYADAKVRIYTTRGLCSYYAQLGGLLVGFETVRPQSSL